MMKLSKVAFVAIATMTVSPAFAQRQSKVHYLVRIDQDIAFRPNQKQFVHRHNQEVVTSSSDSEDGPSKASPSVDSTSEDSPDVEDEPSVRRRNQDDMASSSDSEDGHSEDNPDEDSPDEDSFGKDQPEEDTTQAVETGQSLQLLKTVAHRVTPPEEVSASGSNSKRVTGVFVATVLTAIVTMTS